MMRFIKKNKITTHLLYLKMSDVYFVTVNKCIRYNMCCLLIKKTVVYINLKEKIMSKYST